MNVTSDGIAEGQLRSFVERIERIEEEVHDANADKSEIYKEARGVGFDVKVIRKIIAIRKQDHAERMEQEALLDLYLAALGMQASPLDYEFGTVVATGARTSHQESDLAETRPDGRGKAESGSGEAPDTAPQQIQESTEQPSAAAEVTTPDANTHGQTGTADNSGLAASVPANAEAVAKKVGQSEQEAAIELPVDTSAPAVLRAERHNDDPRCLDKAKCGAMSNFAFCMKCRAAWREQHPLEAA